MANVTVLENQRPAFSSASHGDIHHRSGQVVGTNHLVGEQHPKCGINGAQEAIAEIGLPARLDGVDVRGAKDVHARKSCRGQCLLGLTLISGEGHPASARRIRAAPAQERECRVGTAGAEHSRELGRVVHRDPAEFRVRHCAGVSTQTEIAASCRLSATASAEQSAKSACRISVSLGRESPRCLRPIDVTPPTAESSSRHRRAYPPTIPLPPTMATRFIAVTTAGAPQSSRRRAGAPHTATPRPALRTCPRSEGRRSSGVRFVPSMVRWWGMQ